MRTPFIAVMFLSLVQLSTAVQLQTTGGASLGGIVVRAGTSEPLAGAQVTLTEVTAGNPGGALAPIGTGLAGNPPGTEAIAAVSPNVRGSRNIPPVITGVDGKFIFQNLEAGLYRLQVSRNGYTRQIYGQSVPNGPAIGIRLSAGQSLNGIVVALVQTGSMSGAIRDNDGHPLAGLTIQILQASFNAGGQKTFVVEGSAITNDRGEYRLFWISPGRYYVRAASSPNPIAQLNLNTAAADRNGVPDQSFALTYFPGVIDTDAAANVEVFAGSETSGINFAIARR